MKIILRFASEQYFSEERASHYRNLLKEISTATINKFYYNDHDHENSTNCMLSIEIEINSLDYLFKIADLLQEDIIIAAVKTDENANALNKDNKIQQPDRLLIVYDDFME